MQYYGGCFFFGPPRNNYYFCDYNTNMAENNEEIETRRKQNEYCRNKLLTFKKKA